MEKNQRCNRCVMDNSSDPTITFDSNGVCNYCTTAFSNLERIYFPNEEGEKRLSSLITKVKNEESNKKI